MTLAENVAERVRTLSEADQQKVLDFIQSLGHPVPRKDPRGRYAHRGVHITAEAIEEARREAWQGFPRDLTRPNDQDGKAGPA